MAMPMHKPRTALLQSLSSRPVRERLYSYPILIWLQSPAELANFTREGTSLVATRFLAWPVGVGGAEVALKTLDKRLQIAHSDSVAASLRSIGELQMASTG